MANYSAETLKLFRTDWARADKVAGDVSLRAYNHLRDLDPSQRDIYVKGNTGLGIAQKVAEGSPTTAHTPLPLPQMTISQMQRTAKYVHTLEAAAFDLYNKIPEMAAEAREAVNRAKALDAANLILNNGFDSAYPCATGDELYSDSHTINGVNFDNLASATSLSESALDAMIVQVLQQKGPKNEPMSYGGMWFLYHGPLNAIKAERILGTPNKLGSTDNDLNIARRYFELFMDPFVVATSEKYALIPQAKNKHHLFKAEKVGLSDVVDEDSDGNVSMKKYSIYELGAWMPYNIIGNAGA